jgi:methylated-DNA-[protein]-cysteine S-methyltransferase
MEKIFYTAYESPAGRLLIVSSGKGLAAILLPASGKDQMQSLKKMFPKADLKEDAENNREAFNQLKEYFDGKRKAFDLKLDLRGSDFKKAALKKVMKIPFGETKTYGGIAKEMGNPNASRAVGSANRTNPVPIVIPCHRVIGSNGALVGYGGGLKMKQWLLDFERNNA